MLLLAVLSGCRNSVRDSDNDLITALDYTTSINAINDIVKQIHNVAINDSILSQLDTNYSPSVCFQTKNLVSSGFDFPYILTIDFGSGSNCIDERVRGGKVVVRFSGPYNAVGTLMEITTENFSVQDRKLNFSGNLVVTNADSNYLSFRRTISTGDVELPNSEGRLSALSQISGQDMVEIVLENTQIETDDTFTIQGALSGVATTGVPYACTVTTPLSTSIPCRFENSGVFIVSSANIASRFGNYGDGTCDDVVTLTLHGTDFDQVLRN